MGIFNWFLAKWYRAVGVIVIAFVAIVLIAGGEEDKKPGTTATAEATPDLTSVSRSARREVCKVATNFVKERLKAPGSAKFEDCDTVQIIRQDDKWDVVSYVDAENSFGAKLRNDYHLVMSKDGSYWNVVSLDIR